MNVRRTLKVCGFPQYDGGSPSRSSARLTVRMACQLSAPPAGADARRGAQGLTLQARAEPNRGAGERLGNALRMFSAMLRTLRFRCRDIPASLPKASE